MSLRPDRITEKERMRALFNHQKPDRVPIWSFGTLFAIINSGYKVGNLYRDPAALTAMRQFMRQYNWISTPMVGYSIVGAKEYGGEIKFPTSEYAQAPMVSRYPVETEEDAWRLTLPDIKMAGMVPKAVTAIRQIRENPPDNEPFAIVILSGAFTAAGNICSVERLCRWLVRKPTVAHRVLRLATDLMVEIGRFIADSLGTDDIVPFIGEPTSSNQLISAKHFAEFAFPYNKEINEKLLAMGYRHIFCHVCGDQNLNLPYWAQIPMGSPGLVSIGHEVDIETAAQYFPNDIIVGNIETGTIQMGTPAQVYELSRRCIEKGKKCPGGFILAPGCELPPRAPKENIGMITQAVNDFGWYDA